MATLDSEMDTLHAEMVTEGSEMDTHHAEMASLDSEMDTLHAEMVTIDSEMDTPCAETATFNSETDTLIVRAVNGHFCRAYLASGFVLCVTYHKRIGHKTRQLTISPKLMRKVLRPPACATLDRLV